MLSNSNRIKVVQGQEMPVLEGICLEFLIKLEMHHLLIQEMQEPWGLARLLEEECMASLQDNLVSSGRLDKIINRVEAQVLQDQVLVITILTRS